MIVFPPCKINLGLDILRRRPDGYHDIETVMMAVPWCDILEVLPSQEGADSLEVTGNHVACAPQDNLVMKAVRVLRQEYDFPAVRMRLHKIIPDGAGLGGGSSDAAYAVRAANAEFSLGMSASDMASVLASVGSDCPFFAYDCPMLATGTGTVLQPVEVNLSGWYLVIAKPSGVSVSTRQAYAGVQPSLPLESIAHILTLPVDKWRGHLKNAFEPSVFAVAPQVESLRDTLYTLGTAYASMSGSGSAVYGLFHALPPDGQLREALANCVFHTVRLGR